MLKRETIIALRARHQAHRIASDFLYPHIETPPVAEPVAREVDPDWVHQRPRTPLELIVAAVVIWSLVLLILLGQGAVSFFK